MFSDKPDNLGARQDSCYWLLFFNPDYTSGESLFFACLVIFGQKLGCVCCCCSVAKLYLTFWPHGLQHARLPCPSYFPEFAQTHVHWVSDAIQPSHPLSSLVLPSIFLSIKIFPMSQLFTSDGQSIGVSASVSVLPMNIQDWFPLELTAWISLQSKGLKRVFSNITTKKHQADCVYIVAVLGLFCFFLGIVGV